jgi:hypothetical protein
MVRRKTLKVGKITYLYRGSYLSRKAAEAVLAYYKQMGGRTKITTSTRVYGRNKNQPVWEAWFDKQFEEG